MPRLLTRALAAVASLCAAAPILAQATPASAQDGVLLYSNVDFPTFCLGVGDNGGPNLDAGIQ
jgi:hypothetical protein